MRSAELTAILITVEHVSRMRRLVTPGGVGSLFFFPSN